VLARHCRRTRTATCGERIGQMVYGGGEYRSGGGGGTICWGARAGLYTCSGPDTDRPTHRPGDSTVGKTVITWRTGLSGSGSLSQINYSISGTPITGGGRGELTNTFRRLSLVPCSWGGGE
jgi:hypothetical protein